MELVAHEVKQGGKRLTSEKCKNKDEQNISKKQRRKLVSKQQKIMLSVAHSKYNQTFPSTVNSVFIRSTVILEDAG